MSEVLKITKEEILAVMPQQPPFLFIDEAEIDGDTIKASYRIKEDEVFFEGHFKNNPVFPGTLMLEALGQLGVLYLLTSKNPEFEGKVDSSKIFFISAEGCRCQRICKPGELFEYHVKVKKLRHPIARFAGKLLVNGQKAASAEEMTLTFDYLK
ncbi:MAG: beta-hydroxyacyl-ACP dehydratase [Verrucomicrobiaceae bacterium]|nr:beta-hydroxyacyl-ACP dehydratase [Verrucomicrobiaceae bacterium]